MRYCVNVDTGSDKWKGHLAHLEAKLPSWMWCRSQEDILRLTRQTVPGMNTPQLYLKVPGVWTGGHEENNRFRSINVCHGPGGSVWGAVAPEHVPHLRTVVYEHFGIDLYAEEGKPSSPIRVGALFRGRARPHP